MRFNHETETEYQKILGMMKKMNMPLTLKDLGVEPTQENIRTLKEYNIMKNNIVKPEDLARLDQAFEEIT